MNYQQLLENSYNMCKKTHSDENLGRLEYLSDNIFGFTTYENTVSSLMACRCLQVCQAITNGKTYEYIKSEDGHIWYLLMVNMPFFANKLEWGASIRGAWWDLHGNRKFKIESCGLYVGNDQLVEILFDASEWTKFINAMVEFIGDELAGANKNEKNKGDLGDENGGIYEENADDAHISDEFGCIHFEKIR